MGGEVGGAITVEAQSKSSETIYLADAQATRHVIVYILPADSAIVKLGHNCKFISYYDQMKSIV